jgi:hypothetical protein
MAAAGHGELHAAVAVHRQPPAGHGAELLVVALAQYRVVER